MENVVQLGRLPPPLVGDGINSDNDASNTGNARGEPDGASGGGFLITEVPETKTELQEPSAPELRELEVKIVVQAPAAQPSAEVDVRLFMYSFSCSPTKR